MMSGGRNGRADIRRRPSRRRGEFPFGNSSRGSPAALRSLIRIRRDFIPKWTKLVSSLILPKMTKRPLVILDRSLFDRFGESAAPHPAHIRWQIWKPCRAPRQIQRQRKGGNSLPMPGRLPTNSRNARSCNAAVLRVAQLPFLANLFSSRPARVGCPMPATPGQAGAQCVQ